MCSLGTVQENLAAGTAFAEDIVIGNLAARMAAVGCTHELAIMAGLVVPRGRDASAAAPHSSAAAASMSQTTITCLIMLHAICKRFGSRHVIGPLWVLACALAVCLDHVIGRHRLQIAEASI